MSESVASVAFSSSSSSSSSSVPLPLGHSQAPSSRSAADCDSCSDVHVHNQAEHCQEGQTEHLPPTPPALSLPPVPRVRSIFDPIRILLGWPTAQEKLDVEWRQRWDYIQQAEEELQLFQSLSNLLCYPSAAVRESVLGRIGDKLALLRSQTYRIDALLNMPSFDLCRLSLQMWIDGMVEAEDELERDRAAARARIQSSQSINVKVQQPHPQQHADPNDDDDGDDDDDNDDDDDDDDDDAHDDDDLHLNVETAESDIAPPQASCRDGHSSICADTCDGIPLLLVDWKDNIVDVQDDIRPFARALGVRLWIDEAEANAETQRRERKRKSHDNSSGTGSGPAGSTSSSHARSDSSVPHSQSEWASTSTSTSASFFSWLSSAKPMTLSNLSLSPWQQTLRDAGLEEFGEVPELEHFLKRLMERFADAGIAVYELLPASTSVYHFFFLHASAVNLASPLIHALNMSFSRRNLDLIGEHECIEPFDFERFDQ